MVKQYIRMGLNKIGFDLVRVENSHGDLGRHLLRVIHERRIDCILDVGANEGQYGHFLRSLGYKGYILSFEPVASVFKKLQRNCNGDRKWLCYGFALGNERENKTLNVYESTMFSSFLTANEYSKSRWHTANVAQETVQVCRLDDIWADLTGELGCSEYMLKLDTQGFDKFVFDGGRGCLGDISVLQSELSLIPVYDGMLEAYDILRDYHRENFYISGMYPVNRDKSLAVIEYDCVMVKRVGR